MIVLAGNEYEGLQELHLVALPRDTGNSTSSSFHGLHVSIPPLKQKPRAHQSPRWHQMRTAMLQAQVQLSRKTTVKDM